MLPRSERLTSSQFDRAFGRAQSVRHPLVVLRAHRRNDGDEATRTAFVVPKKQGKATVRNRVRRHLRERYRLHSRRGSLKGCDLIFLSTPDTASATSEQLDAALHEVLRRMAKKMDGSESGGGVRSENESRRVGKSRSAPERVSPQGTTDTRPEISSEDLPGNRNEMGLVEESASSGIASQSWEEAEGASGEVAGGFSGTERKSVETMLPSVALSSVPVRFALTLIRFYQRFISPGLPPSCRFLPTCSHYTYAAIERFGVGRGLWLGMCRICRCHPLNPGGIDLVPEVFSPPLSIRKLEKSLSRWRFWSSRSES